MERFSSLPAELGAFDAASAEALESYGRRLGISLPAAAVVVLTGALGAGKTTLVKGLAEGLGVAAAAEVTSPTYTLVHEYRGGGRTLYHVDLYRLDTTGEVASTGLEELLPPSPGTVVALEWGEKPSSRAALEGVAHFQIIISVKEKFREVRLVWLEHPRKDERYRPLRQT